MASRPSITPCPNTADAARRLYDDENDGVDIIDPIVRHQIATTISESGLYSLILTSRKQAAKRFKKWVTGEVLPAIRKTGGYMVTAPDETSEALAMRALTVLQADPTSEPPLNVCDR